MAKKKAKKTAKKSAKKATKKSSSKTGASAKKATKKAAKKTAKKAPVKKTAKKTAKKKAKAAPAKTAKAPAKKKAKATAAKAPKKRVAPAAPTAVAPRKGAVAKKKKAAVSPPPPPPEPAAPVIKVPPLSKRISKKNLDLIRGRLLERRGELLGSLGASDENQLRVNEHAVQSGGDEIDAATYSVAADLSLRMAESESRELKEIELALSKLEDGSYGVCEATGKPIDVRRLLFMPAARLSLEAQEQLEKEQLYHDAEMGWVRTEL